MGYDEIMTSYIKWQCKFNDKLEVPLRKGEVDAL